MPKQQVMNGGTNEDVQVLLIEDYNTTVLGKTFIGSGLTNTTCFIETFKGRTQDIHFIGCCGPLG